MNISTKFNVGDVVWDTLSKRKVRILEINVSVGEMEGPTVEYKLENVTLDHWRFEGELVHGT